jgi:hypothetical protein
VCPPLRALGLRCAVAFGSNGVRYDMVRARRKTQMQTLRGRMTNCTASVVALLLASFPSVVSAQADWAVVPAGPARTDC